MILPAFGVTVGDLQRYQDQGCTLVDTTCGSVLNVWKNVTRYARDGYTAIIHGKYKHEETRATASQALKFPQRPAIWSCSIAPRRRKSATTSATAATATRSSRASRKRPSAGFDPDLHLARVGLANQTTMLMSRVAGDRGDVPRGDDGAVRRRDARRSLSLVRHDLQRDAGAAGRRHRSARIAQRST